MYALDVELVGFARAGRPKAEDLMQNDEENVTVFTRLPQKLVSWSFNTRLQSVNPATLPYLPIENRKSLKGLEKSQPMVCMSANLGPSKVGAGISTYPETIRRRFAGCSCS